MTTMLTANWSQYATESRRLERTHFRLICTATGSGFPSLAVANNRLFCLYGARAAPGLAVGSYELSVTRVRVPLIAPARRPRALPALQGRRAQR